ncbi:ABC transporter substrate-binding protein [Pokkaliibacter sp. CJK22405]|uniref:ABC transporter substrate-binding protein n=1 Tax=Pokkaliibacter sp. CJK22405 TaxID=3384615 RepID=UPI0039846CD8
MPTSDEVTRRAVTGKAALTHRFRAIPACGLMLLAALDPALASSAPSATRAPFTRVASLNLCTDILASQWQPDSLISLSPLAGDRALFSGIRPPQALISATDAESIAALKPDLLIADSFGQAQSLNALQGLGYELYRLPALTDFASALHRQAALATTLGITRGEVKQRLAPIEQQLQSLIPQGQQRRAIVLQNGGWIPGTGGLEDDLLRRTGLVDARPADSRGWQKADAERIISLSPEVLILLTSPESGPGLGQSWLKQDWIRRGHWQQIPLNEAGLGCGDQRAFDTLWRLNHILGESLQHQPIAETTGNSSP